MKTQELKSTVSTLPIDELMQFSEWFADFMADQWNKQNQAKHLEEQANRELVTG